MPLLKLTNTEKQAEFDGLFNAFFEQKKDVAEDYQKVIDLRNAHRAKVAQIEAFKTEIKDKKSHLESKLNNRQSLTMKDYIETQKLFTELKAKIDFFNAEAEDMYNHLLIDNDVLQTKLSALQSKRNQLLFDFVKAYYEEFLEKHSDELKQLVTYFRCKLDFDNKESIINSETLIKPLDILADGEPLPDEVLTRQFDTSEIEKISPMKAHFIREIIKKRNGGYLPESEEHLGEKYHNGLDRLFSDLFKDIERE
ncbi:hypothetical protein KRX11_00995 [Pasteurellaceae bacterium TAE3-ERU1]|nr:hypothetical protein [Pasteurellaceae bacterium TAE3-ERU1]